MHEIKRTVFKIKLYGQEYELNAPKVKEIKSFRKQLKDDPSLEYELSVKMLEFAGLPMDIIDEMESMHLDDVIRIITGQKKA